MLEILIAAGQAASALLLIYGGLLVMVPTAPAREEKPLVLARDRA